MSYKPMRGYVPNRSKSVGYGNATQREAWPVHACHKQTRQGDEMACACGKRWSVGEDHP